MNESDDNVLAAVIDHLIKNLTDELLALSEEDLKSRWAFKWDERQNVQWNIYAFSDILESYKRACRQWETHHHGWLCVVERVRDKYLMRRIDDFAADLRRHM